MPEYTGHEPNPHPFRIRDDNNAQILIVTQVTWDSSVAEAFDAWRANFRATHGINLPRTEEGRPLTQLEFGYLYPYRCNERGTLTAERLSFAGANFDHIGVRRAGFDDCDFSGADMTGGSFPYCSFAHANLRGAKLPNSDRLIGCSFIGAERNEDDAPIPGYIRDPQSGRLYIPCSEPGCTLARTCQGLCGMHCGLRHRTCGHCDSHGSRYDGVAGNTSARRCCGGCARCCRCARRTVYGAAVTGPFKNFPIKRTCGVEWEFNSTSDNDRVSSWARTFGGRLVTDGSCGLEAVTPPMSGDAIDTVLHSLGTVFKTTAAEIDSRCGIHVHVDAHDITWHDMYRLLFVYSKIEPVLYLLGGQGRVTSEYAPACGKEYTAALSSADRKGAVLDVALHSRVGDRPDAARGKCAQKCRPGKKAGGRYKGLNIAPWLDGRRAKAADTTVEFRLHQNASSAEQVANWAKLCVSIVEWVVNHSDKEAHELLVAKDGRNKSNLRALAIIAPSLAAWILKAVRKYHRETSVHTGINLPLTKSHRVVRHRWQGKGFRCVA